jgi:acyl-CoA synthetase (AMP-forming)/AMP-acid ligase II
MMDDPSSVAEAFRASNRSYSRQPFLIIPGSSSGGPAQLTYEQAAVAAAERESWYREAGYGQSHHVALMLDSRADFYVHWLALNAIGVTVVPIGADLVHEEIRHLIEFGDVDLVVCLPHHREAARAASRDTVGVKVADGCALDTPLEPASPPRGRGLSARAAAIVFTSGSTGRPKGCLLSNDYFLSFGRWYNRLGGRCSLRPGCERFITPLPPNHVNALAFSSMGAIMSGGCVIQLDRFRSNVWWPTVQEYGATVMHYLGVMPSMLLKLPKVDEERGHALRFGIGGGVRGEEHAVFEERFGVPLIESWAMTETGGTGTLSSNVGPRHVGQSCIGRPSPEFALARIADEQGNTLPLGAIGELQLRSSTADPRKGFFAGYYRDLEATEAAWHGGWLHSGDLARMDAEGSIFFVGRRKQIIRRSGENISAAEVEAVLSALAGVRQAAVVPAADTLREEEVFACILLEAPIPRERQCAVRLMEQAAARLSYYKLPGYIAFVESLPTTSTQKLRYGAIGELARALMERRDEALFDLRDLKRGFRPKAD